MIWQFEYKSCWQKNNCQLFMFLFIAVQRQCIAGPKTAKLHTEWEGTPDTAVCGAIKRGATERPQEGTVKDILCSVYHFSSTVYFFVLFLFVSLFACVLMCLFPLYWFTFVVIIWSQHFCSFLQFWHQRKKSLNVCTFCTMCVQMCFHFSALSPSFL